MRLINVDEFCDNQRLILEEYVGDKIPSYAILSHTWGDGEVTFQDLEKPDILASRAGYTKIEYSCKQAARDGCHFLWVDTCCINKESSSELSEAINSMFSWYEGAEVCYVHLDDLPSNCPRLKESVSDVCHALTGVEIITGAQTNGTTTSEAKRRSLLGDINGLEREEEPLTTDEERTSRYWIEKLEKCRWFTRGWTLQEMIAPLNVAFFGQKWNPIGYKQHLLHTLSGITGVDTLVLTHQISLEELSVAKKLSWAAKRKTTREEDKAYSLLGILQINLTLLYGEGNKAFTRLQEEVLRISADCSIFLWSRGRNSRTDSRRFRALKQRPDENRKLLAPSTQPFAECGKISYEKRSDYACSYSMTHRGLQLDIVLMPLPTDDILYEEYLGIMPCHLEDDFQHSLAIHLRKHASGPNREPLYSIERCRPECSQMISTDISPSDMLNFHPVRTMDRPLQRHTSIMIPRDNFQDSMNHLSALEWTASVWVRNVPPDVHFRQAYPHHQWNPHTLTWNRYKSLARESASRAGGLIFQYRGTDILIAFEVYLDTGVILTLLKDDGYELPYVSEHVSELCSATNQLVSRATFSTATGPDEEMQIVARLSQQSVMDEKVWVIDLELRRTEFNMYLT